MPFPSTTRTTTKSTTSWPSYSISLPQSKPKPFTKRHIDAYFATMAHEQAAQNPAHTALLGGHDNNRARNHTIAKNLVPMYMENFGMDTQTAKATVERDVGERYAVNVWDAPREQVARRTNDEENGVERVVERAGEEGWYSDEQWDMFERMLDWEAKGVGAEEEQEAMEREDEDSDGEFVPVFWKKFGWELPEEP